jgi:hypothetical protein
MRHTQGPCKHCGTPTTNAKFCSRSCSASHNNKKPKRKLTNQCAKCSKLIRSQRKFCEDCNTKIDWSQVTIADIQGKAKYQISAYIRTLARAAYRSSDLPKCCAKCGYDKHYEVCHRKPIANFPSSTPVSVVNHLSNLVALCPNHHWELDNC